MAATCTTGPIKGPMTSYGSYVYLPALTFLVTSGRHVTVERVVSRHVAKGTPQGKAARRFVRGAMQPGARNNTEGVTESLLGMLFATQNLEQGDSTAAEGGEGMAAQLQKAAEQLVIAMLNQYLGKQRDRVSMYIHVGPI